MKKKITIVTTAWILLAVSFLLPATTNAQAGATLSFDGANDEVSIPNNASLNISNAITLEAWVYATKNSGIQNVICKSSASSNSGYIFPRTDNGWNDFVAYFHIGGTWRTLSAPYGGLNQWHHMAATYDGTNIRLYKDGVLTATSPAYTGGIAVNSNPLCLGAQTGIGEYFGGRMDEGRVWNRVLSQAEIQSYMNCEVLTSASGLVANYHFNQGTAGASNGGVTTLTDVSGNNNNGTLSGFSLSGSSSNWIAPGGVISESSCNRAALDFDGTNDAVSIPDNNALDFTTKYTLESWIYVKAYQRATLISKFEDAGDNRGWMLNMGESGDNTKLCLTQTSAGTWTNPIAWNTGFTPSLNTWYHIAMTFDASLSSNQLKLYVNGSLNAQTSWAFTLLPNIADVYLGGYSNEANGINGGANDRFFNGKLDEVRLWNRALCQGEIQNNMNCEIVTTANGLVANYHANHGVTGSNNAGVTTLADASGNYINGTLANFALSGSTSNWVAPGAALSSGASCGSFSFPTVTGTTPSSRCGTGTVVLGATASAGALNWYAASTGGSSLATGTTFTTPSIASTTTYYVEAIDNSCASVSRTAVVATVNTLPTTADAGTDQLICGTAATLQANIPTEGTGSWSLVSGTASITNTASPSSALTGLNGTAVLRWTINANGCQSTDDVSISNSVEALDQSYSSALTGVGADGSEFPGQSFTAGATGELTKIQIMALNVNTSGTFNLKVFNGIGMGGTLLATQPVTISTTGTKTFTLSSTINVTAGNKYTFQLVGTGGNIVIAADQANGYTGGFGYWQGGPTQQANGDLWFRTYVTVIKTIPTVTGTTPGSGCGTGTVVLGATASAGTLNWYAASTGGPSLATGTSFTTPSIASTTTYYVDATSNGCTSASRTAVAATVNSIPTLSVTGTSTICNGESTTLTVSGASSYVWNTGATTTTLSVSPSTNSTYTVTGTDNGCQSTTTKMVNVNALPTLSITGTSAICNGESTTLTVSGASLYVWSAGATTTTLSVSPSANTTYIVTGTDGNGCEATTTKMVSVNALPTLSITGTSAICNGESTTLTVSGASSYVWNTGATTATVSVSPSTNSTYTVTGTDNGCESTTTKMVTVNALPTVTGASPDNRCGTGTVILGATASAGTLNWYAASTGGSLLGTGTSFTTPSIASTTTYYVEAIDNSCPSVSRTAVVATVNILPTTADAGTDQTICGTTTTLQANTPTEGTGSWSIVSGTASITNTASPSSVLTGLNGTAVLRWSINASGCPASTDDIIISNSVEALDQSYSSALTGVGADGSEFPGQSFTAGATGELVKIQIMALNVNTPGTFNLKVFNGIGMGGTLLATQPVTISTTGTKTFTLSSTINVTAGNKYTFQLVGTGGNIVIAADQANGYTGGFGYWQGGPTQQTNGDLWFRTYVNTIKIIPTVTGTTSDSRCGTGTLALGATASAGTLNWYAASTGGPSLGTGTNFTTPSISVTTTYYVDATSNGCTSDSRTAVIATVDPSVTPAITIALSSGSNPMCTGAAASFSASVTDGGTTPAYQWKVNGTNAGTNSAVFSTSSLTNGQAVTCVLTSNATCAAPSTATSTAITMTVNPSVTPDVSIALTSGSNPSCSGSSLTFSASHVNGGGSPDFQWQVNGVNAGTNSSVFTTSSLTNGQAVTCVLTSNASCASTSTATSSAITMTVNSCSTGTAVTTVPCGLNISNMSATASAANVTGATQYRLRLYNNVTNALVATKTQASRTFTFNTISGIYYGNTYKWTVAVDKGSGFGPESNNSCTITFAQPKTTVPCGVSYANLSGYTACPYISGSINYRFSFYNNVTNALVATKTQTSTYIYFNTVPALTYGNTYKWTVEVEYNNGTANVFGPASSSVCTITFNAPQTAVPCGNTYAKTGYAAVTAVSGANAYRYNFYDATTSALVATKTNTNTYIYFNLVPGLTFDRAYKWTVAVRYNNGSGNVFGPESASNCTMNYGTPPAIVVGEDSEADVESNASRLSVQSAESNQELLVNVFPNPAKDQLTVEASEPVTDLRIYNVSGELVLAPENFSEVDLHELKAGLYIVSIKTEKGLKHIRIIKE